MPDSPILFLVIGGLVLGFGAWAGWAAGARRARMPNPLPDRLWLCDACHSFNEPEREACYGCHRPRPVDARSVVPDAEFHVDQRFGRAKDGGGRGSTRPWLGADEPLRDAWIAAHPSTEPAEPPAGGGAPEGIRELVPELVLDARAELGEGPVWDAVARELLWVDILGRRVHRFRPEDGSDVVVLGTPSHVGAVAPRRDGGLVLALADGFWLLDPDATLPRPHRPVTADRPETRFNDGKVDPAGRFWAGTMAYDFRPGGGSLYRLEPDGRVETMLHGVTISNGLAWSADQRTLHYIDTPTRRIDAFDHDPVSGAIGRRRTVVRLPEDLAGSPDGMTIDAEGALWVALWDGWAVHRYLPDGTLAAIVRMPVARPTSCAFGGADLGDLYITSAREGLSVDELTTQPHAGGLFRVRPGVVGRPSTPFAG